MLQNDDRMMTDMLKMLPCVINGKLLFLRFMHVT